MNDDDASAKRPRAENSMNDTRMEDDDRPLTAHSILALFRKAIREEGVAKKDTAALETRVDLQLSAAKSEWKGRLGEAPKRSTRPLGPCRSKSRNWSPASGADLQPARQLVGAAPPLGLGANEQHRRDPSEFVGTEKSCFSEDAPFRMSDK